METLENKNSAIDGYVEPSSKHSRNPWRWLLIVLLLLGTSIAGWRLLTGKGTPPNAQANQPPAIKVKTSSAQTAIVQETSSIIIGNLQSRRSASLLPQVQGRITKFFVHYGDNVAAGTPLIEVDPAQQKATVNSNVAAAQAAQEEIENAKATLSQLEAQRAANVSSVDYNRKQYDRYVYLSNQGAVPVQNRDQYADSIRQAQANLGAINRQIQAQKAIIAQKQRAYQQAQANIEQQKVQLGYYTISAPFAGTVGDIPVKSGDYVTPATKLTTVTQNQPLEVNLSIPIEDAPKLQIGMPVELLDAQGRSIGISKIFFIAPNTDNTTQSVLIKSIFDNSNNQLRADQYVNAKVIWNKSSGILVPETAISRIASQNFVFVVQRQGQSKQGQPQFIAKQKPVKLGVLRGNDYQVLQGLQPGEKIVVSGILNLSNGAAISPEP